MLSLLLALATGQPQPQPYLALVNANVLDVRTGGITAGATDSSGSITTDLAKLVMVNFHEYQGDSFGHDKRFWAKCDERQIADRKLVEVVQYRRGSQPIDRGLNLVERSHAAE